jgi:hypothetical protein
VRSAASRRYAPVRSLSPVFCGLRGDGVRKRDLRPDDPYYAAWLEYSRAWWRGNGLTLLLFLGGGSATVAVVDGVLPNAAPWLGPAAIVPWAVGAIVASQRPVRWPCPRCGKAFHAGSWGSNGFARRCLHCKLPKWSPRDPETQG